MNNDEPLTFKASPTEGIRARKSVQGAFKNKTSDRSTMNNDEPLPFKASTTDGKRARKSVQEVPSLKIRRMIETP